MDAITAFQVGSLIVLWLTAVNAWREGHRWLATLLWGVVFGFLVECYNVHCDTAGYYYPGCALGPHPGDGKTWCVGGVPTWVPIGWGCIVYLSAWTAQRLRIPGWAKPIVAAFLAVNFDLALDPVATHQQLWCWSKPPTDAIQSCPNELHAFYLYGIVPFDNFLGWFIIVLIYTLVARFGLGFLKRRLIGRAGLRSRVLDYVLPGLAALIAFGGYWIVRRIATGNQGYEGDSGRIAAMIFIGVSLIATGVTWVSTLRSARDHSPNWAPLVIPAVVQVGCFVLALVSGFWEIEPAILVAIPANLIVGLVIFAWPSLESLLPPAARRGGPS